MLRINFYFLNIYATYVVSDRIALMREAVSTSAMSVIFDKTTWRSIPKDSHLCTHHHENLKSYSSHMLFPAIILYIHI